MKDYQVYFKEVEEPLTVSCPFFYIVSKSHPVTKEVYRWFVFHNRKLGAMGIHIQYAEVAAIIPADYDPAEPGFQVYLKGRSLPLTVKAHALNISAMDEHISFVSKPDPLGPYGFPEIEDVYLAWAEVLAVLPENVTEGEADEAGGEVASGGRKLAPPGRGRARKSK